MNKHYIIALAYASILTTIVLVILSSTSNEYIEPNHEDIYPEQDMNPTEAVILCVNEELKVSFEIHRNFAIFNNIIYANKQFSCNESITLTTHGDYRYLDNIPFLVKTWKGPISVALYAPGYDLHDTLTSIAFLRLCDSSTSQLVRDFVTFHIFLEYEHILINQKDVTSMAKIIINNASVCEDLDVPFAKSETTSKTYKATHNLKYPINVARNLARRNAQTDLVLASDIELYPSPNFIEKFLKMISNYPATTLERKAFVLPVFEIDSWSLIPQNKTRLQEMIRKGAADWFHKNICLVCHKVINGDEWLLANETEGLAAFATGKRNFQYSYWEPVYVSLNKEPLFDERMTWEGGRSKLTQAYVLCLLDYDFVILDNAFLVHKSGFKKKRNFFIDIIQSSNEMPDIWREYRIKYGSRKVC